MLENRQGRFYTAAEKYEILSDLEKWMEETGSRNTLRFCKERNLPVGSVYNWIKFKNAGVPLEDSKPNAFVKGDERIDRGHAQAARNKAIKRGAINPARQHIKPNQSYEERLEAGRDRARQYRERERARKLAELGAQHAAENPLASQRGSWPDETTRTYWAQAILRARMLGRVEVKRVKSNFSNQTGLFPDTINVWAAKYRNSQMGRDFIDALYAGKAPVHAPPPVAVPVKPGNGHDGHPAHQKPVSPAITQVEAAQYGPNFQPLANAVDSFAKALTELGARFTMLDGRVSHLLSEHQSLSEEVHLGTSNLSKILRAISELEPYFK